MEGKIQKWGNSLAVRIPRAFASQAGLAAGSPVDISLDAGRVVISPTRRHDLVLAEMLRRITADNLHPEADFGPAVGKETW